MTLVAHRRLYTHIMNQTPDGHGQTAGGAAKPDAASAGGGSDEGSSGKGAAVQRLQEAGLPSKRRSFSLPLMAATPNGMYNFG